MLRTAILAVLTALALDAAAPCQANYDPLPTVLRVNTSGCLGVQRSLSGTNLYPGPGGPGSLIKFATTATVSATWPTSPGAAATIMRLGLITGNITMDWSTRQPWAAFMSFCPAVPCLMHLTGFTGSEFDLTLIIAAGDTVSVPVTIPNIPAMLDWSRNYMLGFQALHADLVNGCWDMSYAYGFFVGP